MKIAIISHAYQDERYLAALDAMAELPEVEATLIHPEHYKGGAFRWSAPHSIANLGVPVVLASRQGTLLYRPRALAQALDLCRPDLILHEQEVYTFGAAQIAAIARHRSIPLVQFVWENVARSLATPRRLLRRYVLAHADAVIAGSDRARQVHRDWGFSGPITVMPQMGVTACARPRLGRRDAAVFKICFVGRLVPCKGVDCLLRAVADLHRRGCAVDCTIAGQGPEYVALSALARELRIDTCVHFCGHLDADQVRSLMRSSDCLVLPSRRSERWEEQFGLVLAEAMAEATVTVGSRTGAIPGVIGSEELLFAEEDWEGLARILERLRNDSHFLRACQRRLWERAWALFGAGVVARQKADFMRRVVKELRAPVLEPSSVGDPLEINAQ